VSPLELVDDRFGKLASELRASRPVASAALRERVSSLDGGEPAGPRWTFRPPPRRLALGLVAAALAASFVVAGVTGLSGSGKKQTLRGQLAQRTPTTAEKGSARDLNPVTHQRTDFGAAVLAPNAKRLQRYDATLRLRVKDVNALSNASRRATKLTRSLGGYVASVNYATRGGKQGGATLVLRVPVANIQTALGKLTSLGTILRQQTGILDVTRRADRESKQIAELERRLAKAFPAEAPAIRLKLRTLRAKHAQLLRSAQYARIALSLTTPAKQAAATPSRFDRTLDNAGLVLVRELEILLYALVVAGPLLLLGGAAVAAGRAQRRRSDQRLLERA
jgi:hypothetical protein